MTALKCYFTFARGTVCRGGGTRSGGVDGPARLGQTARRHSTRRAVLCQRLSPRQWSTSRPRCWVSQEFHGGQRSRRVVGAVRQLQRRPHDALRTQPFALSAVGHLAQLGGCVWPTGSDGGLPGGPISRRQSSSRPRLHGRRRLIEGNPSPSSACNHKEPASGPQAARNW